MVERKVLDDEPRNVEGMTRAEFEQHLRIGYQHDNVRAHVNAPTFGLTEKQKQSISERVELNYPVQNICPGCRAFDSGASEVEFVQGCEGCTNRMLKINGNPHGQIVSVADAQARATQQATKGDGCAADLTQLVESLRARAHGFRVRGKTIFSGTLLAEELERHADTLAEALHPVAGSAGQAPTLAVWYGSMPETNGKSNWTAILHNGDIATGITLDRSEYPDRVRYESDRARWLIGELAEEPFILDYDADKHSGYKAPTAPSLTTDAGAVAAWKTTHRAVCVPLTEDREVADMWRAHGFPVTELVEAHPEQRMSDAARDVLAERARQVNVEGWTPAHDDQHGDGQLALVAGSYALACAYPHERDLGRGRIPPYWPWDNSWWKPTTPRRNLIKAGALTLAEIERIDRAARKAEIERSGGDA